MIPAQSTQRRRKTKIHHPSHNTVLRRPTANYTATNPYMWFASTRYTWVVAVWTCRWLHISCPLLKKVTRGVIFGCGKPLGSCLQKQPDSFSSGFGLSPHFKRKLTCWSRVFQILFRTGLIQIEIRPIFRPMILHNTILVWQSCTRMILRLT
jgi:hypothetical protein